MPTASAQSKKKPPEPPSCHSSTATSEVKRSNMEIPDVAVLDQEGNKLHFYTDLIKGKTVAINFIFTNCTTICPPLAATFARLQKEMGGRVGKDVHLISISVDPVTDTPERLKTWGAKFKAGPGWTFVTGEKQDMDKLLNALGAAVSKREDHTPSLLIGNDAKGIWTRTYGLAKIPQIIGVIQDVIAGKADETSAAGKYFSDVELMDQDGRKLRFYTDVLKNKVVAINTFYTTCTSICPPMNRNFEKMQEALGDRLGQDVFLVSISVDPATDTPTRLKDYGKRFHAKPGWLFLTGKKENVDWALYKLGQYVETKDEHTSIFIIGNEPKGLWKKAFGLANADELIKILEDVIADRG
jgi:cytochrome oxidase Cu insertion factor (SCO1/SenC/PrrC family)